MYANYTTYVKYQHVRLCAYLCQMSMGDNCSIKRSNTSSSGMVCICIHVYIHAYIRCLWIGLWIDKYQEKLPQ